MLSRVRFGGSQIGYLSGLLHLVLRVSPSSCQPQGPGKSPRCGGGSVSYCDVCAIPTKDCDSAWERHLLIKSWATGRSKSPSCLLSQSAAGCARKTPALDIWTLSVQVLP